MGAKELVERLAEHRLLGAVPPEERSWVAAHGQLRRVEAGDRLTSPDLGDIREMFIVLSGRVTMYLDRPGGPRRVTEWCGGDVTGLLPYSRLSKAPGVGQAEEPTEVLLVHRDDFPEMIRECPVLTEKLVQRMLDRARLFTRSDLLAERLVSLGRVAAGLAHELDNPASAVVRGAKLLADLVEETDRSARAIGEAGMSPEAYEAIETVREECLNVRVDRIRSPLEQVHREEELVDWLEDRGLDVRVAESLSETPISTDMLETLAAAVEPRVLDTVLRWVAAGCAVRVLASEIAHSASDISDLVRAVKGWTQMDGAAVPKPVDIREGLAQTLTVLRAKARAKGARVTVTADPDLPRVPALGGELNQVWANLLDNALDAIEDGGSVVVSAAHVGSSVVVSIVDDGPGVPDELRDRIFEPFFTTKPVGEGTGLGLDIVNRLVENQQGRVELDSEPGRTEFRVVLPVVDTHAAEHPSENGGGERGG
jgi:signal transduction histidine kinase